MRTWKSYRELSLEKLPKLRSNLVVNHVARIKKDEKYGTIADRFTTLPELNLLIIQSEHFIFYREMVEAPNSLPWPDFR